VDSLRAGAAAPIVAPGWPTALVPDSAKSAVPMAEWMAIFDSTDEHRERRRTGKSDYHVEECPFGASRTSENAKGRRR
jgi:hypothetical protein